jgi:hypothetical protein
MTAVDHEEISDSADGDNLYDHLTNSRPLQWDRVWRDPAGRRLADYLLQQLEAHERRTAARRRARKATDRALVISAFEMITADLYAGWATSPALWLAYPRRREEYGQKQGRYDAPQLTLTSVVTVADHLLATGFAEQRQGSYRRKANPFADGETGSGYRTRIKATAALAELIEEGFGLSRQDLGHASWRELVRLKGPPDAHQNKPLLDYEDMPETVRMRKALVAINQALSDHDVSLSEPLPVDLSNDRLYRVFNNGSFTQGGRFYGGWWQTINAARRSLILINGEPTVELDFVGLHPRMMYHLEGIALVEPFDPYAIPGFATEELRPLVKLAFNQLVNISGRKRPRAPKETKTVLGKRSYRSLLDAIERHHAPVGRWFRSGRGLELQRLDSDVAEQVMLELQSQGICCLPIHDSFIVPASSESALRAAMIDAYQSHLRIRTGRVCLPAISRSGSFTPAHPIQEDMKDE